MTDRDETTAAKTWSEGGVGQCFKIHGQTVNFVLVFIVVTLIIMNDWGVTREW